MLKRKILKRNKTSDLPQQLKSILQKRIEDGYYAPGQRVDSVRKISMEFSISAVTVQRAFKILESEGYIRTVPASGMFVNENFQRDCKPVKVAFVFSDDSLLPGIPDIESWALNSEFYRGLLSGGEKYGAKIDSIHVTPQQNFTRTHGQVKQLCHYDGVVFIGDQLLELQRLLARMNQCMVFQYSKESRRVAGICMAAYSKQDAFRMMAQHIQQCGCRTAGVVSYYHNGCTEIDWFRKRAAMFATACCEYGIRVLKDCQIELTCDGAPDTVLCDILRKTKPDFLFCNHADFAVRIYRACRNLGLQVGKDIKIAGMATGVTFQQLLPSFTHVKVPVFQVAEDIIRVACLPADERKNVVMPEFQPELVVGESTVF